MQTFAAIVLETVAAGLIDLTPTAKSRIFKGLKLTKKPEAIRELSPYESYEVTGSKGACYSVTAQSCTCPDSQHRQATCYHQWAIRILRKAAIDSGVNIQAAWVEAAKAANIAAGLPAIPTTREVLGDCILSDMMESVDAQILAERYPTTRAEDPTLEVNTLAAVDEVYEQAREENSAKQPEPLRCYCCDATATGLAWSYLNGVPSPACVRHTWPRRFWPDAGVVPQELAHLADGRSSSGA